MFPTQMAAKITVSCRFEIVVTITIFNMHIIAFFTVGNCVYVWVGGGGGVISEPDSSSF